MKSSPENCANYPQNGGILKSEQGFFKKVFLRFFSFAKKLFSCKK